MDGQLVRIGTVVEVTGLKEEMVRALKREGKIRWVNLGRGRHARFRLDEVQEDLDRLTEPRGLVGGPRSRVDEACARARARTKAMMRNFDWEATGLTPE
jgi:hypothetical protein